MDGNQLKSFDKSPRFFDGRAVVELEINEEEYEAIIVKENGLFVQKIEDNAGNAMAGTVIKNDEESPLTDIEEDAPEVEKVEATANNKLVVTFTQRLLEGNNINKEAFDVKVGEDEDEKTATIGSISVSRVDGKTVVTLNIKDAEIDANAKNVKLTIKNDGEEYLKNLFGVAVKDNDFDGGTIEDKIAPSIVVKEGKKLDITAKNGEDGKGVIEIKFDEAIDDSDMTIKDFEVNGYKVVNVEVTGTDNNNIVKITLDKEIKGRSVKLTQIYPVKDTAENEFKLDKTETITVTDPQEETEDETDPEGSED